MKQHRKYLSVERRDLRDNSSEYNLWGLPSNKLKHMLRHKAKKDRRIEPEIMRILKVRGHLRCGGKMNKDEPKKHLWNLYSLSDGEIGEKPPEEEMEKWE